MTAVAIDSGRCGVDIEALDRDFSKGVRRILSARELSLSGSDHWPAAAWCAKEAMYKYYGRRGVDMAREWCSTASTRKCIASKRICRAKIPAPCLSTERADTS